MLRVGLTGGIGCGKTTVASMMRDLGCHILEADKLAHQLIEPGGASYEAVVRGFGAEILTPDGRVNRARLGSIVFADPAGLARLNGIVHPPLLAEMDRMLDGIESADPNAIAVIDAALLIEFDHYKKLDCLVVVLCTPEQQLARLTDRTSGRGMSREQAERRIGSQLGLAEKRKLADEEIDCSGTLDKTRRQVQALVKKLQSRAASRVGRGSNGPS